MSCWLDNTDRIDPVIDKNYITAIKEAIPGLKNGEYCNCINDDIKRFSTECKVCIEFFKKRDQLRRSLSKTPSRLTKTRIGSFEPL